MAPLDKLMLSVRACRAIKEATGIDPWNNPEEAKAAAKKCSRWDFSKQGFIGNKTVKEIEEWLAIPDAPAPVDYKLHKWEQLDSSGLYERMTVPGGWIYSIRDGLIFVPHPQVQHGRTR